MDAIKNPKPSLYATSLNISCVGVSVSAVNSTNKVEYQAVVEATRQPNIATVSTQQLTFQLTQTCALEIPKCRKCLMH